MRKTMFLTLALLLGLSICATGAWAYMFNDNTLVEEYQNNGVTPTPTGNWQDVLGPLDTFDLLGADLTNVGGQVHLIITTNWSPNDNGHGGDVRVQTTDLFLDFNMDGIWDAAVVLNPNDPNGRALGTVYLNPTITTSLDVFGTQPFQLIGGKYDESDPKVVPVLGMSQTTDSTDVVWNIGVVDPNTVDILLTGIDGLDVGNFQFLATSATCANDAIVGQVPLPGTLMLLGSGLLGIGVLGWRRGRKQI